MGFAMEFIMDHLREVAQAFFMRRVQPTVDAILISGLLDDDAVPFFLFFIFFFSYYFIQNTYMFPITLIWHVFATVWVCNYDAILCYYFYYCYDIDC